MLPLHKAADADVGALRVLLQASVAAGVSLDHLSKDEKSPLEVAACSYDGAIDKVVCLQQLHSFSQSAHISLAHAVGCRSVASHR